MTEFSHEIAYIKELEADNARLTAERDAVIAEDIETVAQLRAERDSHWAVILDARKQIERLKADMAGDQQRLFHYEGEIERLKVCEANANLWRHEYEQMRAENERLKWALRFYARPIAYQGDNVKNDGQDAFTPRDRSYIQSVGRDGGEVARRALEPKP